MFEACLKKLNHQLQKTLYEFVGNDAGILKLSLFSLQHARLQTYILFDVEKTNFPGGAKNMLGINTIVYKSIRFRPLFMGFLVELAI